MFLILTWSEFNKMWIKVKNALGEKSFKILHNSDWKYNLKPVKLQKTITDR
jgi:hypothetical protein